MMADLWLEWGGDLQLSATGGLLLADGDDLARQRIARRLFTAVQGYVWHQDYGAGMPQRVGAVAKAAQIEAVVKSQMLLESAVARVPPPKVTVSGDQTMIVGISYADAATGQTVSFSLTV